MNPQSFGKYQLIKKLATGGMAEVWLARQTGIEGFAKNLVVKRILPHLAEDLEFVEMFRNEALIAARFNHPNIAQVYEFGEANGTYYIAMEYIHGEDLGRVMRKAYSAGQWIARPLAIRIVASACEGLYYAHTRTDDAGRPLRVVHRDISPQNILISFDGSVKLVDFGIAKAADQASLTKSGAIKGKFAYMAPEQAAGKALDGRADIFAIGLVLYELLTCDRPLKRDSELGTLQAALECAIPPPSSVVTDVPPELDAVVMKALTKAADDRYRDARQFQLALEEFLVGQRWVASSVQISELMETLFVDRLEGDRGNGSPEPAREDSRSEGTPRSEGAASRDGSREGARSHSSTEHGRPDLNWEAPPAEVGPPRERGRVGSRPPPRGRSDSSTQTLAAPLDELESEAPAPEELPPPRRRTSETPSRRTQGGVAVSRTSSRTEVGRLATPEGASGRRSNSENPTGRRMRTGPDAPGPRPSRGGSPAINARARSEEVEKDDELDSELPPEPPRRRTSQSQALRRRTSAEAPAPTPAPVTPAPATPQREPRQVKKLLGGLVALVLVGMVAVFHEPLWAMLNASAGDGREVLINLDASEPVQVFVEHGPECGRGDTRTVLSAQPTKVLRGVPGAHEEDILVLENKPQGIFRRVPVPPPGEPPGPERTIPPLEFKKGTLKLRVLPRNISNLQIYREGEKFADYTGMALGIMEGTHHLELRGAGVLKAPIPLPPVVIRAGEVTESAVVDLRPHLAQ
jgi:eukaryotic-like serine/threonine-protein kinase